MIPAALICPLCCFTSNGHCCKPIFLWLVCKGSEGLLLWLTELQLCFACPPGLYTAPDSCKRRCHERFNKRDPCHCNTKCEKYQNCCEDYYTYCSQEGFSHARDAITDEDLLSISEKLYKADHNRAQEADVTINLQHFASAGQTDDQVDRSSEPLYTHVNERLFSKPTYASFIKLLDNYHRQTGTGEKMTAQQQAEQDTFLREAMNTALMKELYGFLHQKGRYGSEEEFVADLKEMWFGLYSRGKGEGDSSGFEHIFSGEVKKGKVSGFHNWIRFYLLEKQGQVNYYSHNYDGPWTSYPDVLGLQFSWDGFYKEVGSAFIGCSPEFEFGLYTLCFIARPGKVCHLSLGGQKLGIQTYTWTKSTYGNGRKYIATAYVTSP
uniref:Uridylate-specific endoribonuclease n=1 Tax=Crocodylus porosus TaxID=8502 RepID=A0A7M4E8Z0_CROPO